MARRRQRGWQAGHMLMILRKRGRLFCHGQSASAAATERRRQVPVHALLVLLVLLVLMVLMVLMVLVPVPPVPPVQALLVLW